MLIDPDAALLVKTILAPGDFFIRKGGWVCKAIYSLVAKNTPVDFVTVRDQLDQQGHLEEAGGAAYLSSLINTVPSALHAEAYARQVADHATRRRLINAGKKIVMTANDLTTDIADARLLSEQALTQAVQTRSNGSATDAMTVAGEVYGRLDAYGKSPIVEGATRHLDTGWIDLNRVLGGWRPGLIGIMAVAHMGKSFFVLKTTAKACSLGKRVMTFTLEMSATQLVERYCLMKARVKQYEYERGVLSDEKWETESHLFVDAMTEASEWDWIIDDQTVEIGAIISAATLAHLRKPLDLVVVDPIGLLVGGGRDNRNLELGYYSRQLKNLSGKLGCPVIAVHHIGTKSVANRVDKRPRQSDGYEAGHFDQDVDVLLGLHREDVFDPNTERSHIMDVLVLKDRLGGGVGFAVELFFVKSYGDILDAETRQQEPPPPEDDDDREQWQDKF